MVLVLPDLVMDGQHAAAVEMLSEMLRNDSQFTAPVLDSLGSLQLNPEMLKQVSEMVTDSVASANVADLPIVIRFLLQHMTKDTAKDVVDALRSGLGVEALNPDGDTAEAGQPGLSALQASMELLVRGLRALVREAAESSAAAAAQLLALLCDEYKPPHIAGAEALPVELEDGELEEGEL